MEDLKNLVKTIIKHSQQEGIMMDNGSIINFLDHVSSTGDDCDQCAKLMRDYTGGEVTKK